MRPLPETLVFDLLEIHSNKIQGGRFQRHQAFLIKSNEVENDLHKNLCFYRKTFLLENYSDLQLDSIQYGQFSLGQIISFL